MASSNFGVLIQTHSHDKYFFKAVIDYITSLSPNITCTTDPLNEFDTAVQPTDHKPSMSFSINGMHVFTIYRNSLTAAASDLYFKMDASDTIPATPYNINYFSGNGTSTPEFERDKGFKISHIINDNFVFLSFAGWANGRETSNFQIVYSFSNNSAYLANKTSVNPYTKVKLFDLSGYTLYSTSPVVAATFLSRFSYAAPVGEIDYIKSSIYMSSNEKVFENRSIYDCTTVTVGDTVSLKDGAYVAVGPHQLVKVS